jgi:hypothetical protein
MGGNMTISTDRILDVKEMLDVEDLNADEVSVILGISLESASRYMRLAKALDKPTTKQPKILLIDIETAPCVVYTWRTGYKLNIPADWMIEDWYIICYAAKWLLDDGVFGDCVTPQESLDIDDKRVMTSLYALLEEADIIIAHNGNKFDIPKINARLIEHGFDPPSPYITIDTLLQARKSFAFDSNKLDMLCQKFELGQKDETKFELWVGCKHGDQQSLDYMYKYNRNDVVMLEGLYLYLRPWMTSHPNLALFCDSDMKICNHCMAMVDTTRIGWYTTPVNRFPAYRCECGAILRGRLSDVTREERANYLISTAR